MRLIQCAMAFMKFTRGRLILIAILVALFAAYTLFGFFGVPRLLHSQATGFVAREYGRKIDIGEIQFNPFTLVLKVHGLSFPDSEGQPLVGFRELLVEPQCFVGVPHGAEFRGHRTHRAIHAA